MSRFAVGEIEKPPTDLFQIDISEDEMTAFARIKDFSPSLQHLVNALKKQLAERKILKGLLPDNIKQLLKDQNPQQRLLIARGKQPQAGKEAELRELVNFTQRPDIDPDKLNLTDLSTLKHQNLVRREKPLLRIIPPKSAINGVTVTGKPVLPKTQVSMALPDITLDSNVAYSPDDKCLIIALTDGLVTFINQTVAVEEYRIFDGDCDIKQSPVECDTPVIIMGDAKTGLVVEAAGDVEIYGTVEDVRIKSGRDIIIYRGYVGHGKGLIKAERNALMMFALYQQIEAGHTIFFVKELIGCKAFAGRVLLGRAGCIIGGECEALLKLQVHFAGSEESVVTRLVVGRREILSQRRYEMDELVKEYQDVIKQNKQKMYELVMKQMDNNIDDNELEHLMALQLQKKSLPKQIDKIEKRLTQINAMIKDIENAHIEIRGIINEKVCFAIGDATLQINEKTRRKRYHLVGEKITTKPL